MNRHEPKTHPSSSSSTSLDVRIPFLLLFVLSCVATATERSQRQQAMGIVRAWTFGDWFLIFSLFFLSFAFISLPLFVDPSFLYCAIWKRREREKDLSRIGRICRRHLSIRILGVDKLVSNGRFLYFFHQETKQSIVFQWRKQIPISSSSLSISYFLSSLIHALLSPLVRWLPWRAFCNHYSF